MRIKFTAILLALFLCFFASADATESNYALVYNGYELPVTVAWNGANQTVKVTYASDYDYFVISDLSEEQSTTLLARNSLGEYETVRGVICPIADVSDKRGEGQYRSVTLAFIKGGAPYVFEPGIYYAISFDIAASGYHHTSAEGSVFPLGAVGSERGAQAAGGTITGAWLSETEPNGQHTYMELHLDASFLLTMVSYDSQYEGTVDNWGDGRKVEEGTLYGEYSENGGIITLNTESGTTADMHYVLDGDIMYLVNEYGEDYVFHLVERYGADARQYEPGARYDEYPVIWSNGNAGAVEASVPDYDALITVEEAVTATCLTTYHWNDGRGDEPGTISILTYDVDTYEETLVGTWQAEGRDGYMGAPNVYWDIFPNVTLEPGIHYFVDCSNEETWSWNEESDGCGFIEVRGFTGEAPERPTSGLMGIIDLTEPEDARSILWTNANDADAEAGARDYYVMFDLPTCTVTQIETCHITGGGAEPGQIMLYGDDGSEYGPYQAYGADGPNGEPNAYWIVDVNIDLAAGMYAVADESPETWASNSLSDGWGMTTIYGTSEGTGNPFGN